MALGPKNITTNSVAGEIGISSNTVSVLVGTSGLNKYSYYAPGSLVVDNNADIVLIPPDKSFKLGDFRNYDHNAPPPAVQTDFTLNWGPDLQPFNFNLAYKLEGLNIYAFEFPADFVTVKIYLSAADRESETNHIHSQIFTIQFAADIPLAKHTRQSALRPVSSGWQAVSVTGFDPLFLPGNTIAACCEMFLSDVSGNRKINFGSRVNNYTTITFQKVQQPQINPGSYLSTKPAGYTVVFPEIHTASVACGSTNPIQMTWNESGFSFYVKARGVYQSVQRILEVTSCEVRLNIGGSYQTVYTGALSYNQGTHITGTLSLGDGVWGNGDVGVIEIVNEVYGSNYTTC
jgi:hypothetical protein